jgi:phenylacetic acid degradation protein paaN
MTVPNPLFDRHRKTLEAAVTAIHDRGYFSAYPEVPSGKIYGETARDDGIAAFKARLDKPFAFDKAGGQSGSNGSASSSTVASTEQSPYGFPLGITYPQVDVDDAVAASKAAMHDWSRADIETRVGVCMEVLDRLNKRSFELACAVMHTTGQGFMMAFQAGGPHAQDRGLEAVAYAYEEMIRHPQQATWRKQVSKTDFITLQKTFRIVPRGVSAVIACSTFPTWNSYPAIFASLTTGNGIIIKPHPGAILPLAITADVIRTVLAENGFDPDLVMLMPDTADKPITKPLVTHPDVRIVDYTGGSEFGQWVEDNAKQAVVFTEKAGINSIILDSIGPEGQTNLKAVSGNLAFTVSLYSGQMCTTSQNIFIPRDGITVDGEHKSFDEVAQAIVGAVNWFLSEPARAAEVLGAVQNEHTAKRVAQTASEGGEVLRPSESIANEQFPQARTCSPLILKVDAGDKQRYMREMFGPIVYLIATDSTDQSIELAADTAERLGAITCAVYSTNQDVLAKAEDAMTSAGVPVSCNLTGQIFVNQSAAFSDFHVSGANPSGNATLTDGAFVSNRFRVVQSRIPVAADAAVESKPEPAQAKA